MLIFTINIDFYCITDYYLFKFGIIIIIIIIRIIIKFNDITYMRNKICFREKNDYEWFLLKNNYEN